MDRRRRAARTVALMSLFTMTDTQTNVPIASFVGDGSDLVSLSVAIEPVQDLNGYDNPWPAGGGKNLLRMPYSDGTSKKENGIIYSVESNGSLRARGTAVSQSNFYFYGKPNTYEDIKLPSGTYAFSINVDGTFNGLQWFCVKSNGTLLIGETLNTAQNSKVIAIDSSETYRVFVRVLNGSTINATIKLQIESGSTATPWAPYSNICPISGWAGANIHVSPTTDAADGETYSITFPSSAGTVYGGTLDVTSGKLTVDRAMVDLGTLSWGATANGATQVAAWTVTSSLTSIIKGASTNTVIGNIVCTKYKADTANNVYRGADTSIAVVTNGQLTVYDTALTGFTSAQVIAAMSGVQLCYELATPIVYDLTPTQVTTLIGTNNIWADTGDIKYIEYNI